MPRLKDEQKKEGASPGEELAARLASGSRLGSGSITADEWGLVTIRQMRMQKGGPASGDPAAVTPNRRRTEMKLIV